LLYIIKVFGFKIFYLQEGTMKKIVLLAFWAMVASGIIFAQTVPASTTINGTIGLNAGKIAVKSGTTTYYTRGLERFIGFIDGLKDGAQVTLEGYVSAPSIESETERLFFPVKLTIDGKSYEVGPTMTAYPEYGNHRMGRGGYHGRGWW
jgi:hypothetical protein